MKFVGQVHIINQLRFILPNLYKNQSVGANFLLDGPSGYGKTTLAISIAKYLVGKNFEFYLGEWTNKWTELPFHKRVIFIDEVHKMDSPEILYPLMDEKSHVLILATNENGNLPEALRNRCYEFTFDEYDDTELLIIARESATFFASDESFMEIIRAGGRNPREIKSLVDRLGIYFSENPQINSGEVNFTELLNTIFRIEDGLNTLQRRYLEVLEDVGGNASLSLLRNLLSVSDEVLKNRVEPVLARKGLIKITQKGRSLVYVNTP